MPSATRPILIIGAGLAGLAAAQRLREAGEPTIIFEARRHIGGRVATNRSLGVPVELGAMWIHRQDGNPIRALAERFDLELRQSVESNAFFEPDGRRLTPEEARSRHAQSEVLFKALDVLIDAQPRDVSASWAVEQFLTSRAPLSPEARAMFNWALAQEELSTGGPLDAMSSWFWEEDDEFEGDDVVFPGGYDQLLEPLSEGLDVRLSSAVNEVSRDADGVHLVLASGRQVEGRACIVTLPLGCLQDERVVFSPPLPKWKRRAIRRLGAGRMDKVILAFDDIFWDEDVEFLHPLSETFGDFTEFWCWNRHVNAPILIAPAGGRFREQLWAQPNAQIVERALDALRRIHGESQVPSPTQTLVTRWSDDPWSRCSYTFIPRGGRLKDCETLSYPVDDRVFFAGEATSWRYPGTTHGAWLSGIHAAERVLNQGTK